MKRAAATILALCFFLFLTSACTDWPDTAAQREGGIETLESRADKDTSGADTPESSYIGRTAPPRERSVWHCQS